MHTRTRVLYLEADPVDQKNFLRMVQDSRLAWDVAFAETLAGAAETLRSKEFDVIVANHHLPDGESEGLVQEFPATPFVLVANNLEESLALRTLAQGAEDYLIKDIERRYLALIPISVQKALQRKEIRIRERRTAEQLDLLIRGVSEYGIYLMDAHGFITTWNFGAEKIKRYTAKEIIGRNFSAFFTPEDIASGEPERLLRLAAEEGIHNDKGWRVRKDGTHFWAEITLSALHDERGNVCGFAKVSRDMTDRKQHEQELIQTKERAEADFLELKRTAEALRASEERSQSLLENASQGILTVTAEDRIIMANHMAGMLFGYEVNELIGSSLGMLVNLHMRQPQDILLSQGAHWTGRRKDGSEFPLAISSSFVKEESGGGLALVFISDITERINAEEKLKGLVKRIGLATKTLQAGIWEWHLKEDFADWDDTMRAIYAVPEGIVPNYEFWSKRLLPHDLPQAEAALQGSISSKSQSSMEFHIRLPDGSIRCIASFFEPVVTEDGEVTSLVGTNLDVTDRKNNEQAVRERTMQLQVANRELEEFAYVASHDLKAPLRAIDNTSRWLEEDLEEHLTGEMRENMNMLRGRVKRMEKLLDDLLEYARIGRVTDDRYAELVRGDLLVNDILTLLAPPNFTVQVSPGFADILLRRMPLQQVLMNLIGNAVKHHNKPNGRISVTVEEQSQFYEFAVSDDGPGIPAQFHEQIFKMFQTLKPRDVVEGSGMGLALVRKAVEVFGGSLQLVSAEGQGSTFRFTWPKQQQARDIAA